MSLAHIVTSLLGESETLDANGICKPCGVAMYIFSISTFQRQPHQLSKVVSCYEKMSKRMPGSLRCWYMQSVQLWRNAWVVPVPGRCTLESKFFSRKQPVTAVTHTDFRHVSQFVGNFYLWLMAWFTYLDDLMRCLPSLRNHNLDISGSFRKLGSLFFASFLRTWSRVRCKQFF